MLEIQRVNIYQIYSTNYMNHECSRSWYIQNALKVYRMNLEHLV